jgi:hypothetical protein
VKEIMELILILVAVAVIWFFASGKFKANVQDPQTLRPDEIEDLIVELKKKILITSEYSTGADYERLERRLNSLMGQVLSRHQHFVLDVEASIPIPYGLFRPKINHDGSGMRYTTYVVEHDLDPSQYAPNMLIYACFFIWHGGQSKDVGPIDANPMILMKILDFLVNEKKYGPALFMKGLVRKYGLQVYSECFPVEARQLLEQAKEAGVGSAAIELANLSKFAQLAGVKSV